MNQKNSGGPAFPVPGLQNDEDFNGMTLRDYAIVHFTAAWTAALANRQGVINYSDKDVAYEALHYGTLQADVMLAERAK